MEHKLGRSYGICCKGGTQAKRNLVEDLKESNHLVDASSNLRIVLKRILKLSKEKTNLMPLILLFYSMFIQCSTCFGR